VEKYIFQFDNWIYQHYGRMGLLIFLLVFLAVLALAYYLLSRLPEPKGVAVCDKCPTCKYKCEKNGHTLVMRCPKYELPRWNQFKKRPCPCPPYKRRTRCEGLKNPAVFNRDELPDGVVD